MSCCVASSCQLLQQRSQLPQQQQLQLLHIVTCHALCCAGAGVWPCAVWGLQHNADVPARCTVRQVFGLSLCDERMSPDKLASHQQRARPSAAKTSSTTQVYADCGGGEPTNAR